jgi:polysaccharide biosynthesis protein PslH
LQITGARPYPRSENHKNVGRLSNDPSKIDEANEHSVNLSPEHRSRPRMLFLCQTLPFPPDSGVHLRSYNVLRLLARVFDVTALCFYRRASRSTDQSVELGIHGLSSLAKVEAYSIPQEFNRVRFAWDHLRSLASRRVYTRYVYSSDEYKSRLVELLDTNKFDVVHMDSLDLSEYLPYVAGIPTVCTHHNVESRLLHRTATAQTSFIARWYVGLQARLMENEERRWCPNVNLNVVVSQDDMRILREISPDARFTIVPSGVDTHHFTPGESTGSGIIFVGGHSWFPNRDGMTYFCQEILPHLREQRRDPQVTWVGHAPNEARREFSQRYRIEMLGFVDDIRPSVQQAACYIVPLRVGGGTRLKILDAWSMGKAIVSTSVGCEGLEAVDGENILIRDDPKEFASAVNDILVDAALRARLERGARSTAEKIYDWDSIFHHMTKEYFSLLDSKV